MSETIKEEKNVSPEVANATENKDTSSFRKNTNKVRPRNSKREKRNRDEKGDGFDHKIIDIRRVTRMFKGGRRLRLSVFVVVGDGKGRVGLGIGKGIDVRAAQEKAVANAKKNLIKISLQGNTIPHDIELKNGAAKVLLKPAKPGTGVVAGSSMRMVAEVAGIKDVLGKILGTNNKISNAYATVEALNSLRTTRL